MKNLPEDELFNFVENRLRNYNELPDEEGWNKIASAVTSGSGFSKWTIWTNRTAATLSLVILFFLFNNRDVFNGQTASSHVTVEKKNSTLPQSSSVQEKQQGRSSLTIDNSSKASINSFGQPKEPLRSEDVHIGSIDPAIVDSRIDEALESHSKIDKTSVTKDSEQPHKPVVMKENELKEDSATSFGHVILPARNRKRSRLEFYSMISPSLSFQHITPESEDGVVVDKINSPGVISSERFGFSIETGIQGRISERFQYIAGLSFYQQYQQISYEENSDGSVIESGDDLNFDIKPATTTQTFDYNMRNVGVQVGVLYTLKQRGLMHKAGVLFQYQMGLIKAHEGDVYDNSSSDYFNYQLLYRLEYTLPSGLGLFVQPSYLRSIIANESLDAPFKLKPSRASLGVGIVYRF